MTDIGLNKVYVINLDKDFERLKNIEANFKKYNISYTRVPGVYGKNLTKDEIDSVTTPICRMFSCNKGIIGSGLSHFKALQTVSKERDGFYMICEDDINFNDNTIQYLNDIFKIIEGKQRDPIMISLNACNAYQYNNTSQFLIKTKWVCGISCYILTPETARRFVDFIDRNKINQYIDMQMSFCKCGIDVYFTRIPIVDDSDLGGYLTSNNMNAYSLPLLQFLMQILLPERWSTVINFRLNITLLCFQMIFCLSIGHILLILCMILNVFLGSFWFTNYIAIELAMICFSYVFK